MEGLHALRTRTPKHTCPFSPRLPPPPPEEDTRETTQTAAATAEQALGFAVLCVLPVMSCMQSEGMCGT